MWYYVNPMKYVYKRFQKKEYNPDLRPLGFKGVNMFFPVTMQLKTNHIPRVLQRKLMSRN